MAKKHEANNSSSELETMVDYCPECGAGGIIPGKNGECTNCGYTIVNEIVNETEPNSMDSHEFALTHAANHAGTGLHETVVVPDICPVCSSQTATIPTKVILYNRKPSSQEWLLFGLFGQLIKFATGLSDSDILLKVKLCQPCHERVNRYNMLKWVARITGIGLFLILGRSLMATGELVFSVAGTIMIVFSPLIAGGILACLFRHQANKFKGVRFIRVDGNKTWCEVDSASWLQEFLRIRSGEEDALYEFLLRSYKSWHRGSFDKLSDYYKLDAAKSTPEVFVENLLGNQEIHEFINKCFKLRIPENDESFVSIFPKSFMLTNKGFYAVTSYFHGTINFVHLCKIQSYEAKEGLVKHSVTLILTSGETVHFKLFDVPKEIRVRQLQKMLGCDHPIEISGSP